jgi:ABC-type transport system involved in cytochrome bd biosynthesis fused ATPase/permease subunit
MKKRDKTSAIGGMMKRKKSLTLLFVICYLLFGNCFAFAQTAERIEKLLQQDRVTYRDAALLVLEASGQIDPAKQSSADDAFSFAKERGWLPKNAQADNAARLNGLSLLMVRAFEIKGGAFFSLFKNPHYAYRAMVYRGIIQGRADPQMFVSGDLLFYTVNKVLEIGSED